MKKATITLMLLLLGVTLFAQEDEREFKTLFGNGGFQSNGAYGGVSVAYSNIDDRDAILIGGRGAWLINKRIGIGLAGQGFLTETKYDNVLDNSFQLVGGYGGLLLEFVLSPNSPVHVSIPLTVGAGGVSYIRNDGSFNRDNLDFLEEDSQAFFVVEPGIEVELNLIKFMRMAFGVSYRYTSTMNLNYANNQGRILASDALRGLNAGITLKFGKF